MKKAVVLLAVVLLLPLRVSAQETGIGIGWEDGLSVRFGLGPIGLQAVTNLVVVDPEIGDSVTDFDIIGYANYPLIDMGDSILRFFGGIGVATTTQDDIQSDIFVRTGLQHDFFASDVIVINAKAGVEFYFDRGFEDIDDTTNIFGFYGAIGLHWFFGGL